MMTPLLDEARRLQSFGYRIVPLVGKAPIVEEWEWSQPSLEEAADKFATASGIGHISCARRTVLDLDGEQWQTLYAILTDEYPELDGAPAVRTGRGRMHLHLQSPGM